MRKLLIILGLATALIASLTRVSEAAPSAFELQKPSRYNSVELSPSGRYLAYLIVDTNRYCFDDDGQMVDLNKGRCGEKYKRYRSTHQIKIYDLKTSQVATSIDVPRNMLIDWLEWASEDRILASLRAPQTFGRKSRGYSRGASRIVSFPRTGGKLTPLFSGMRSVVRQNGYMSRISNTLPADPDHIIMPARKDAQLDLWKVNVVNGKAELIEAGLADTFYWFTDKAGTPVLRFDCKNARCRTIYVFTKRGSTWTKIKTLKRKPNQDITELDFWPLSTTNIPGQYYMLSREDEAPRRSVKIFDLNSNSYVRTVFEHPKFDVGGWVRDLQTGDYAGAWYTADRLTYDLLDQEQQKHLKGLNSYFKNKENVRVLGYTADKSQLLVYVSSPNNAGEYYIYNVNERRVERLLRRNPLLDDRLASTTNILTIPTRDGAAITAYHSYSAGTPKSGQPLLVMPHGGPERRDDYDFEERVQYFATRGYQVLQINFRGSSGYGRAFAEAGYGEWGGVMQNDITDAVKFLHAKGDASHNKTCIIGYSYGGYAALYGGASTPELYKCIVSGGGVSDIIADLKRTKLDYGSNSYSFEYWQKSMGDLKTDKEKLAAKSPINLATNFSAPVLLLHGEYDSVVKLSQSKDMAKALKRAGKSVTFVEIKDEGHSNWDLENDILYLETVEKFVAQHVK